jgi:hypothetical protein
MRIRIVLMIVLALWPWRTGAQDAEVILASADRELSWQTERELPWFHPRRAGQAAYEWTADLKSAVRSDWGYKVGATFFIVGNAITFSFPLWAALGADAYTVTAVIIVGEAVDVVGIYVLGEEAFHDLKETLREMANQWGHQMNQLGDQMDEFGDQLNQLGDRINRLKPSSWAWS